MKRKLCALALGGLLALGTLAPAFAAGSSMENFTKKDTYSASFRDVPSTAWYQGAVQLCTEYDLMRGTSAGVFSPTGSLTVAQAVVMADRVHEIYHSGASTIENGSPWYRPYVDYAVKNGILKTGDFTNYNAAITRADMAYLFAAALPAAELSARNNVTALPDVTSSTARASAIYTLYNAGVLTGSDAIGTFHPGNTINRAEAAAILSRVALPAERKTLSLYQTYSYENVSFVLPAGSTRSAAGEQVMFLSPDTTLGVGYLSESGTENTPISTISADALLADYLNQLEMTEQQALTSSSIHAVHFGTLAAYRIDLTLTRTDGLKLQEYAFIYRAGGTLYSVTVASVFGNVNVRTVANSVRVGGQAVTPAL